MWLTMLGLQLCSRFLERHVSQVVTQSGRLLSIFLSQTSGSFEAEQFRYQEHCADGWEVRKMFVRICENLDKVALFYDTCLSCCLSVTKRNGINLIGFGMI
jgi:hypothetical protein